MYSSIYWQFDDVEGINPTGEPSVLSFDISYSYESGCGEFIDDFNGCTPAESPQIEILRIESDFAEIDLWYHKYIDENPEEYDRIYLKICEGEDA